MGGQMDGCVFLHFLTSRCINVKALTLFSTVSHAPYRTGNPYDEAPRAVFFQLLRHLQERTPQHMVSEL